MSTGDRHDPVLAFRFSVEIGALHVAGFSEVSGLQAEIEIQEYREGGVNTYIHKRAGPTKYPSNLILKKGLTDSTELWSWYTDVLRGKIERKQVDVVLMNNAGEESRRWKVQNAYPVKWTGPDLKGAASEVAVETFELAHEGLLLQ
jgi:phage tail-like protein